MGKADFIPRYSIADYLLWEGDWELWDGIPVSMAPSPTFEHQRFCGGLLYVISSELRGSVECSDCIVVSEMDWHVDANTVVRPDVLVVCEEVKGTWIERPPVLVAEVLSPSMREKDLTAKKSLYAENGVRFYLIGDPATRKLVVLELDEGRYIERSGGPLELHEGCFVEIDAEEVFR